MKTIVDLETDLVKPYIDAEDEMFAANIAPVETSPTTAAYTTGEQIIFNGVLYDVTADIASGGTLTVGTNIAAADDVVTQIKDTETELADEIARRNVLGAKNLLKLKSNIIKSINTVGSWNSNVYTHQGITFTLNEDSDGNIISINVNGTSTATNTDLILIAGDLSDYAGKLLTGCPAVAKTSIRAELNGSPYTNYGSDTGSGVVIASGIGANCKIFIRVDPSTTISNKDYYPMIRIASDPDTTFRPYAMTNLQLTNAFVRLSHNIPRIIPKDITEYITDGSFWKRLAGTDGYELYEDIYVGDYIKMSRAITAPNQDSQYATTGSQYVTIAGIDMHYGDGNANALTYHHVDMVPGQGFEGIQHFGRKRMNPTNSCTGGYVGSEMFTDTIGAVVSAGSTATGATINQQLYAEFGAHLKTHNCLLTNSIVESGASATTGYNRFGTNTGCSNNWAWTPVQAVLMCEVEAYGSVVWSSSGYDTGNGNVQLPLFAHNKKALNNRSAYYWLRDVASAAYFCFCNANGSAYYYSASYANLCVRPRFILA